MSMPALKERPVTFEDVVRLDPDACPGDLLDGVFVPVSRNTWTHGEIVVKVSVLLSRYLEQHPGWSIAAGDPGAKLRHDPDRLRGPDVGLIRAERRPTGKGTAGWLEGAPDLAVEVMGDDEGLGVALKKAVEYLAAGARMVWVLDADSRRVVVVLPPDRFILRDSDDLLDGGELLPGFSCRVADLFA